MLVVGVAGREIFDETTMVVVGVVVCKIAMGVGCLIICPTRIWILVNDVQLSK